MEVTKAKAQTTTENGALAAPSPASLRTSAVSQNAPHSLAFRQMNSIPMTPHQRNSPFLDGYMENSLDLGGYPGMGEYHRIPGMTPDMQMQGMMPGEGPVEHQPPETFRTEYNGALQGVQSLLQLLYATTGIINFGGIALRMTFKAIKYLGGGSLKILGYIFNPKHFTRLIRVLFSNGREAANGLSGAFESAAETGLDAAALGEGATKANKLFFVLRLVSLIGAVIAYVLKRRSENILKTMEEKAKEQELKDAEMVMEVETNEETITPAVGELMTTSEEFWSHPYGSKERLAPLQPKPQYQDTYKMEDIPMLKSQWMPELPPIPEMKHAVSEHIEITTATTTTTATAAAKPWLARKKSTAAKPLESSISTNESSLLRSQSNYVGPSQASRNEGAYN